VIVQNTLLCLLLTTSIGYAGSLYSNVGPNGDSYQTLLGASGASGGNYLAMKFVAGASGTLRAIFVPIESLGVAPALATLALYADQAVAPGALLEAWNLTIPGSTLSNPDPTIPLKELMSSASRQLMQGQSYWFVASPTIDGLIWAGNGRGVNGRFWYGFSLDALDEFPSDSPELAIRVEAVTEPAKEVLFAFGLGVLLLGARRRSRIRGQNQ
jgi:hypothetical protein